MPDILNFFDQSEQPKKDYLSILPVSVIDIEAQKKRQAESHSKSSSRANYSPFPKEIATLCCEFFLKNSTIVFDPFAGWGERHNAVKSAGKTYIGFDTSEVAIKKAKEDFGVDNILADSSKNDIPNFNGLLTCPPYWNLEKYHSDAGIDRIKTWEGFIDSLRHIFSRCYEKADVGTTFCIMVGDWRSGGVYYDLEFELCKMFKDFGASVIDKVIVSRKKISKIKIMLPQCKRLGYTVHVHENLLIFRKS